MSILFLLSFFLIPSLTYTETKDEILVWENVTKFLPSVVAVCELLK